MDNQHKKIKGYRDLSQKEIDSMNKVKVVAEKVGELLEEVGQIDGIDVSWFAIGKTDLQKGFMSVTRAIAKPEFF